MKRSYRAAMLALVLLLLSASAVTAAPRLSGPTPATDPMLEAYAKPQRLVDVGGGRRIHLSCLGQGSPTVIFTTGLGDWLAIWDKVQPAIARTTRTCAWDRAGFGFSDPSREPQDVSHTTADLERTLRVARIAGPYVIVGHSLGGYESVLFADRHPRDVAGMVLVDPSFPDQNRRLREAAPVTSAFFDTFEVAEIARLRACEASPRADRCFDYPAGYPAALEAALRSRDRDPRRWATQISTNVEFPHDSLLAINPKRTYGSMPLIVLTAADLPPIPGVPARARAQFPREQAAWKAGHDRLAALSTIGVNRVVSGTSHYIQTIRPAVVIQAIDSIVNAISARRQAPAPSLPKPHRTP